MGGKIKKFRKKLDDGEAGGGRLSKQGRKLLKQSRASSFRCVHCGFEVPTAAAGTQNRNHCPLCLWSRHVDEAVGDRASSCLAGMEPLGLTLKTDGGELQLIHRCTGCGKISKNRLAGDDNTASLEDLFERSKGQTDELKDYLAAQDAELCLDWEEVSRQLYGR